MSEAVSPRSYFFNLYAVPPALVALLIFATGIFVFLQNRRSPANVSFFLFCLTLNFWLFGTSMMYCTRDPGLALGWYRRVVFLGVAHISPLVFAFSVFWLGLYEKQKRLVQAAFVAAPLFYLTAVFTPYGMPAIQKYFWGHYPVYGAAGKAFLFFFFGYFLAAFFNFFSELRREAQPLRKKQIQFITVAYLISITGSVDYLPKLIPLNIYPLGFLSVLAWTLIVAYSIVRYRIMDIQTVVHKTIMWALTSLLFALPLVFLSYLGKPWLVLLEPAWFSGIVFIMALLFMAYFRLIQPRIDHLFQRRQWDLTRAFEKFTDELVHLKGIDELLDHIVNTIKNVFYVDEISIFLSRDEESGLESAGRAGAKRFYFDRSNPFIEWLGRNDVLVLRDYLDLDPKYHEVEEAARKYFEKVGMPLCVPLVVDQRLLGVINIGPKANLKGFSAAEINFLSDLRKTAAIALSNSLRSIAMRESLRRWNVELEKKVEERTRELKEAQSQLIQAEKLASIGTLAGGIAHEINNPLTAVLTNVQMLKMLGGEPDPESLSLIEEGARRCKVIIQKLMRYARKTGEAEVYEEVDLNRVIRNVCDFLGYQLKQENIELKLSLGEVGPIAGIPNELEQVFTNLILNARDAIKSAARKGEIEIKTGPRNGGAHVEFEDNGVGIKKENLTRIFDPFYTTKDVGSGTGLGLTVSSGIVEKHLGKISVSSVEGRGTKFEIQFPKLKGKNLLVTP